MTTRLTWERGLDFWRLYLADHDVGFKLFWAYGW